jgi:hypothetical protein
MDSVSGKQTRAGSVLTRLPAAAIRAVLVMAMVLMPAMLLGYGTGDWQPILALMAILAAAFTLVEYMAVNPTLVEFRAAPPFNRARFSALFAILLCVTMIFRGDHAPSAATHMAMVTGTQIALAFDFPYSPILLMGATLPPAATEAQFALMRAASGVSFLIGLISIIGFITLLRLHRWPNPDVPFNVWINLPQFDPTQGGDVVRRLQNDGRVNVILGLLLPFLIPVALQMLVPFNVPLNLEAPQTLIWTVALWAFLPASLIMRGVALTRVADMIQMHRDRTRLRAAQG